MTHKAPSGAKHAPCTTHVPHAYPSNGWLCIDDEPGRADAMRTFADHLVASAAEHHTLELERSAARPADGSHARWEIPVDVEPDNVYPVVAPVCRKAEGYCQSDSRIHLHRMGGPAPERSAEDRAAVARMSAELYARKGRPAPASADDLTRAAWAAEHPDAIRIVANTGTYCTGPCAAPEVIGARDPAPEPVQNVAPEPERSAGHLGYTWTLEGGLCEVYTVGSSVCRAPLSRPVQPGGRRAGREWWPVAYATMYQPDTYATVDEAAAAMAAAGPIASADAPAPVLDVDVAPVVDVDVVAEPCAHDYQSTVRGQDWYPGLACVICGAPYDYGYQLARDISATTYVDGVAIAGPLAPVQPVDVQPEPAPVVVDGICYGCTIGPGPHPANDHEPEPAPVLAAPAPVDEPELEPVAELATICEHGAYADLCITCNPGELAPDVVERWRACAVTVGSSQCTAGTTGHPGPHAVYVHHEPVQPAEPIDEPVVDPEPVQPAPAVLAPVLTIVQPSSRPTCARCGQTFRQSGAGYAWHRVNRPDCAAGARPAVLAAV